MNCGHSVWYDLVDSGKMNWNVWSWDVNQPSMIGSYCVQLDITTGRWISVVCYFLSKFSEIVLTELLIFCYFCLSEGRRQRCLDHLRKRTILTWCVRLSTGI